ncbi:acyltransferase [Cyanobium sp. To12R1]|uniref:acyltransferase n=1 Tax=Cyanobium sp. To12R1 TaxID=2823723 RepID=UPI0020CBD666|nr:hypothetical protein [Cyanobium sp. To12R1]MCP9781692.1 hypothetical protein [Cyanobium sp. To12R1]
MQICRGLWFSIKSSGHISWGLKIGKGVKFEPGGFVTVKGRTYFEDDVHFQLGAESKIVIGENVWISRGGHICSMKNVEIGDNVMIGEFTSIRDTTHSYDNNGIPMKLQKDITGSIVIESDVWIGRGCLIQSKGRAITIGTGSVVAANSVLDTSVPPYEVWGGCPARFIKQRI